MITSTDEMGGVDPTESCTVQITKMWIAWWRKRTSVVDVGRYKQKGIRTRRKKEEKRTQEP